MADFANLDNDMVVIENPTDEDLIYQFDNKRYRFKAGARAVAPIGLAKLHFGHWELTDPVDRQAEIARLQARNGVEALGTSRIPEQKVKVMTLGGDPISTVLDDPHGQHVVPTVEASDEVERLRAEVQAMQEKFAALHERLGASVSLSDIPVDSGTRSVSGGANGGNGKGKKATGTIEAAPPDEELSDALGG